MDSEPSNFESGTTPNCCGDDSGERYTECMVCGDNGYCYNEPDYSLTDNDNGNEGGTYNSDGTEACCNGETDCVDGSRCYSHSTRRDLTGSVTGFCYGGNWLDCDGNNGAWCGGAGGSWCGNFDMPAGEANVGEYDNVGDIECCGDDNNEEVTSAGVGPTRCCRSSGMCIDSGGTCRDNTAETLSNGNCDNGIDDDCDGNADYADSGCKKDVGALCDSSCECLSGNCNDWRINYMGSGRNTVFSNYRCAPNAAACVDLITPGYHYDSTTFENNKLLCCNNYIYRCSLAGDACNYGTSIVDTSYNPELLFGSYKCYCSSSSNCEWRTSAFAENCDDEIDNDCDGDIDYADSDCTTCTDEGGEGGTRNGCYTSNPSTWDQCGEEKTTGTPYCQATYGSTYECYGCRSDCGYDGTECCINDGDSCSYAWAKNDECCDYHGTADGNLCHQNTCQPTDVCDPPYDACSTSFWSIDCLMPSNFICCVVYIGDPPLEESDYFSVTVIN